MQPFRWARGSTKHTGAIALLLIAGLLWLLPAAHGSGFPLHREDRLHREIEGLEARWRDALLQNDVATMGALLADDYLGINPNGTLETKADAMALRRSGQVKISSINTVALKVHVYGETAVVTSRVDLRGQNGDHDISGMYHYTRVYSHRGENWKIVSFEASRLPGRGERR